MKQFEKHSLKINLSIILFLIAIIPLISSTTILSDGLINNTEISSLGLNLTINFTTPLYAGVIINSDSIYFENLRSGLVNRSLSFNLTKGNATYNGTALPLITAINTTFIRISYGINESINVTIDNVTVSSCNIETVTVSNGTILKTYSNPTCTESPLPIISLIDVPLSSGGVNITYYIGSGGNSGGGGGSPTIINQTNLSSNQTEVPNLNIKEEKSMLEIAGLILIVIIILGFIINTIKK